MPHPALSDAFDWLFGETLTDGHQNQLHDDLAHIIDNTPDDNPFTRPSGSLMAFELGAMPNELFRELYDQDVTFSVGEVHDMPYGSEDSLLGSNFDVDFGEEGIATEGMPHMAEWDDSPSGWGNDVFGVEMLDMEEINRQAHLSKDWFPYPDREVSREVPAPL